MPTNPSPAPPPRAHATRPRSKGRERDKRIAIRLAQDLTALTCKHVVIHESRIITKTWA